MYTHYCEIWINSLRGLCLRRCANGRGYTQNIYELPEKMGKEIATLTLIVIETQAKTYISLMPIGPHMKISVCEIAYPVQNQ